MTERQARRVGQLGLGRSPAGLELEAARGVHERSLSLDDVHRQPDRARVIRDRALNRLPDPPGCIRREAEAWAPVELLDRAVEADRALLDQVDERNAE